MSAPLPLGLRNPYTQHDGVHSWGAPCSHCQWNEGAMAGARAVIARLRADAFLLRRVGLQEPIQKLAEEYERELKGET